MELRKRTGTLLFALLTVLLTAIPAVALKQSSLTEYTAHLQDLRALVQRCEATATACDPGQVGDDEQVKLDGMGDGANVNEFEAHYDWLRKALKSASDP
jgi:hypothetical protein